MSYRKARLRALPSGVLGLQLDEAEEVTCGSIRTFLHYPCSEGTKRCENLNVGKKATGAS